MHRQPLLARLFAYRGVDAGEEADRLRIIDFVRGQADCFERSLTIGHITGSAWLIDRAGARVLLTCHKQLGRWLQLGGHADGDPDVLAVALREAREESGIGAIVPLSRDIFDVDIHTIPSRAGVPGHEHLDVRFLLCTTSDAPFQVSEESTDLAWVSRVGLGELDVDESVLRMHRKWERMV